MKTTTTYRQYGKGLLSLCLLALLLLSCGNNNGRLKIEGSFKGLNQGELYIFGQYGSHKLDTIGISKGEFRYQIPLEDTLTLVMVFPNFSELPIFAVPGATIEVKGDATHLKEAQVKGTKENEQMTAFRLQTNGQTPPEVVKSAADFIRKQPASPVSRYILDKYFIRADEPDYQKASELAEVIRKAMPEDSQLAMLCKQLKGLQSLKKDSKLPAFSAVDIDGKRVSSADLKAKANVITLWASWNYESTSIQNNLQHLLKRYGDDLKVLSVNIDPSVKECRRIVRRDSVKWSTVCDGRMWETPVVQTLGFGYMPDNIVMDSQGKIVARSLNLPKLRDKLRELLE